MIREKNIIEIRSGVKTFGLNVDFFDSEFYNKNGFQYIKSFTTNLSLIRLGIGRQKDDDMVTKNGNKLILS